MMPLPSHSYTDLRTLERRLQKGELDWPIRRRLRCAVAAGFTSAPLLPLLDLFCRARGLACEMYEPPFGTWIQETLDPSGALHAFHPDVILLLPGPDPVPAWMPGHSDTRAWLEDAVAFWKATWQAARRGTGSTIVQGAFVLPAEQPGGLLRSSSLPATAAPLQRLNLRLAEEAGEGVRLHDTDALAASVGRGTWLDPRHWHHGRMAVSFECLPVLAHSLAASLAALCGLSRKALLVDLDNTLWGGVVGDLGLEQVEIGSTAVGEAFQAFQRYLADLVRRGVLLAACSRNDPEVAREPFRGRCEMVLTLDDFACFVANGRDKASNVRAIAETLHLGMDALAFVDDDPVERDLVRQVLPEVAVVDLPEDPAEYVRALDEARLFDVASWTREDAERTRSYQQEAHREAFRQEALDLETFLRGLGMVATVTPLAAVDVPRAAQLLARTNQFNLTGWRPGEAELHDLLGRPERLCLCLRLRDRFGDHGLVSVLLARTDGGEAIVDQWVMSCRVLARGVEKAMRAKLAGWCEERGLTRIQGTWVPLPRNGLVREVYAELGFEPGATDDDGTRHWIGSVVASRAGVPWIAIESPGEVPLAGADPA